MEQDFPILVVDDDIVSRTVIEKYLHKAGFDVATVGNGVEALGALDNRFFPIVLTDWMMPELDGPELCRRIREKETDGYVFIILVTSRDSKTDIVSGLEAGADDYLTKPIHPAELVARINTGIRILKLEQSLKQANEEIRLLSITDSLTGCYNRTYLGERFPQEINRAYRYHHPLSVVLGDMDHFKKINDSYGHQVGDAVLKSFSSCLLDQIRSHVDWTVRYGGEEFLIILPETDCDGAVVFAERLRRAVESLPIKHEQGEIPITASFGGICADFSKHDYGELTMELLINQADDLLYCSKREGRNRVTIAEYNTKECRMPDGED